MAILVHDFDDVLVLGHCSIPGEAWSFGVKRENSSSGIELSVVGPLTERPPGPSKRVPNRGRRDHKSRAGT